MASFAADPEVNISPRTWRIGIPPDEAYAVVTENRALVERLLAINIEAEKTNDGSVSNYRNGAVLLLRIVH